MMKGLPRTARTGIVCTIGPASRDIRVLRRMMRAGMDVARLNFSHGTHADHLKTVRLIRELNRTYRRGIRILGDLEGYRIRIGTWPGHVPIDLKRRQQVRLSNFSPLPAGAVPFEYEGSLRDIRKGMTIFLDDGTIALTVKGSGMRALECEVTVPGTLKEHKGINIPEAKLRFSGVKEKDRRDIGFCVQHRVEYLAQSFVRTPQDMRVVAGYAREHGYRGLLFAKIENRQGIENVEGILAVADGIMVARGDMGVSIPVWEVPVVQKQIIRSCNLARKPVITATQMLESMTEHLRPTRAEATDVANAVFDGTDYVMLSAETAVGAHPVETVDTMNRIIKFAEANRAGLFPARR
jgi:pyruvate kinase